SGIVPSHDGTRAGLLASMERAGVDGALNCPIAARPDQVRSINRWAAEQNAWPVLSLGSIHPDCDDVYGELRLAAELGLPGVKMHPEYQQFHIEEERLVPVWQACDELGLSVLLHCGGDLSFPDAVHRTTPTSVRGVIDTFPHLKFIAAHFGGWRQWEEVETHLMGTRVLLDLSFVFGDLPDAEIVRLVRAHGVDKVFFGSDAPWRPQDEDLLAFLRLPFTDAERDAILWGNAARLLGFSESGAEESADSAEDSPSVDRDAALALADEAFLHQCRVDCFRGSGRGGQKRNRTDSAVRITHEASGMSVTCDDTRSQHTNRRHALRKLREEIALALRCTAPAQWSGQWRPGAKSAEYAQWLAVVIDVFEARGCRVGEVAAFFGVSSGRFRRDLSANPRAWRLLNELRTAHELSPLRA
ncbi:MAG: amidohydrolase family protein, partial [Lentisphaeria bacterium]|nr:amidohydrolase family protein [Lentisphaeria bacterium]